MSRLDRQQGTYQSVLPDVFPYTIKAPVRLVTDWTAYLIEAARDDEPLTVPNGSSFAVTSDAENGTRNLWLSQISLLRLVRTFDHPTLRVLGKEIPT
jgi:hypothetical protein